MIVSSNPNDEITVVKPGVARLTAANAKAFKDETLTLINNGASQIVVDFSDVTFIDSSGLGALVGVLKKIGNRGEINVAGLSNEVELMFRICRMDSVFSIYGDVETAVQALAENL